MARKDRYYRHVTAMVLQTYYELESGSLPGGEFDVRVLDYRIDVDRVFRRLPREQQAQLTALYRDGLSSSESVREAEIHLGRLLEQHQLLDVETYLTHE